MMREIKFRAWKHVNTPEMFNNVQAIDFKSGVAHLGYKLSSFTERTDKERLDNLTLMQYTGLKDINGVEIYECDILEWDGGREGISKLPSDYIIEVLKSKHLYIELKEHTNAYMFYYDTSGYNFPVFLEEAKIVGNIYENKELLGGGSDEL